MMAKCSCQHCGGHIEFDASGFKKGETRSVSCPHCAKETKIVVPKRSFLRIGRVPTIVLAGVMIFGLGVLASPHIRALLSSKTTGGLETTGFVTAALFTMQGEILNVSSKQIVVSTFTVKPVYQASSRTVLTKDYMVRVTSSRLVPTQVEVGEEKVPGKKIILVNYPANLSPAVGQTISFAARRTGTSDYKGDRLELWNFASQ